MNIWQDVFLETHILIHGVIPDMHNWECDPRKWIAPFFQYLSRAWVSEEKLLLWSVIETHPQLHRLANVTALKPKSSISSQTGLMLYTLPVQ
jgi:hypothetical protein